MSGTVDPIVATAASRNPAWMFPKAWFAPLAFALAVLLHSGCGPAAGTVKLERPVAPGRSVHHLVEDDDAVGALGESPGGEEKAGEGREAPDGAPGAIIRIRSAHLHLFVVGS